MEFRTGTLVAASSPIKSTKDLKAARLPFGYSGAPLFQKFTEATLANGGYTFDDVRRIPVTSLQQGWDTLAEGKIDASTAAVGKGYLNLIGQKLGGIRFIECDNSPEALARMNAIMPGLSLKVTQPAPQLTGVLSPTTFMAYYMTIFTSKNVSDDVVYGVAKAIIERREELLAASPLWRTFEPNDMGLPHGAIEYHPGAIKLLREKGAWQG